MKKGLITLLFLITVTFVSAKVYNIVDFGAKANSNRINTREIQQAIDSCSRTGGGVVYVPAGEFLTGTIQLKSKVNLFLETGAVLKGSSKIADYKFYQSPLFSVPSHYGVIFAENAEQVSISGFGAIDGNEEAFFDWSRAKKIEWSGTEYTRQKELFRNVEKGIGDGPVVPKEDRPRQMIIFSNCKNVVVKDVQVLKAPFWSLHFADCDGVTASGLKVWTSLETPNSDGIDITSCSNVIVTDCDIRTGDDAIAITGYAYHFELPGFNNYRHTSQNIIVSNCNLQSRSSGIRIGFMDQNSIKNIHISNVNITNSNRGIGIFVRDEGSVENVTISQVNISTRMHTGDWWGNGEPIHLSAVYGEGAQKLGKIKNVLFRDITCESENGILIYGSSESSIEELRLQNLKLTLLPSKLNNVAGGNIDLRGAKGAKQLFSSDISAIYAQYLKAAEFSNVEVVWGNVAEPFFKHGLHISNFDRLRLIEVDATSAPSNRAIPAIYLEKGTKLSSDNQLLKISK